MGFKHAALIALACAAAAPAWAVNKCTVNGKVVYQDAPCSTQSQKAEPMKVWDSRLVDGGGKVRVGMTEEEVIRAWGKPSHVNTTITAAGTRKQLVYGSSGERQYLYLDEGVLTSIQTPE